MHQNDAPQNKLTKRNLDVVSDTNFKLQRTSKKEPKFDLENLKTIFVYVLAPVIVGSTIVSFILVIFMKQRNGKKGVGEIQGKSINQKISKNTKWISVDWTNGRIEDDNQNCCSGDDPLNALEV